MWKVIYQLVRAADWLVIHAVHSCEKNVLPWQRSASCCIKFMSRVWIDTPANIPSAARLCLERQERPTSSVAAFYLVSQTIRALHSLLRRNRYIQGYFLSLGSWAANSHVPNLSVRHHTPNQLNTQTINLCCWTEDIPDINIIITCHKSPFPGIA
jgi:hypothetical protein